MLGDVIVAFATTVLKLFNDSDFDKQKEVDELNELNEFTLSNNIIT